MSRREVPTAPAAPSSSAGKALPVIAAAVALLAGGGWVGYRQLFSGESSAEPAAKNAARPEPAVIELEPFVLNLADPAGDRYFRLNLRLVIDRPDATRRMESGLPQAKLRDRILAVLSKKRASELTTPDGKEALRAELLAAAEALVGSPSFFEGAGLAEPDAAPLAAHVLDAYFTEFLVQ